MINCLLISGYFEIINIISGQYLTVLEAGVIISDSSMSSYTKWFWKPKEGSDVWGFIIDPSSDKVLTISTCQDDGTCKLKLSSKNGEIH